MHQGVIQVPPTAGRQMILAIRPNQIRKLLHLLKWATSILRINDLDKGCFRCSNRHSNLIQCDVTVTPHRKVAGHLIGPLNAGLGHIMDLDVEFALL